MSHLLGPERGRGGGVVGGAAGARRREGGLCQAGLFTNSHKYPPSTQDRLGSMAPWPGGRPGAGPLGSNPGVATGAGQVSLGSLTPPYLGFLPYKLEINLELEEEKDFKEA